MAQSEGLWGALDFEYDVAIGQDNATAYLAGGVPGCDTGGGCLNFYDTQRSMLQGSLALASIPTSIALTPGDGYAVLTQPEKKSVAVVSLADRRLHEYVALGEAAVAGATRPHALSCRSVPR